MPSCAHKLCGYMHVCRCEHAAHTSHTQSHQHMTMHAWLHTDCRYVHIHRCEHTAHTSHTHLHTHVWALMHGCTGAHTDTPPQECRVVEPLPQDCATTLCPTHRVPPWVGFRLLKLTWQRQVSICRCGSLSSCVPHAPTHTHVSIN